jgi:CRISPR/Cas system-associated exonuclease Cas4 (RecB family)
MLEAYRAGKPWQLVLAEIQDSYDKLFDEEKEHYGNIPGDAEKIVHGYIAQYEQEDKGLKFITVEKEFGPFEILPGITISVTPDAIVEDTMGRLLILEMKTGKRLPDEDFHIWNLQTLIYTWGARKAGYDVKGILWDHIRTKLPTEPRPLKDGGMSRRLLDTTYQVYFDALVNAGLNPDEYSGILDALKKKKEFYQRTMIPIKEPMIKTIMNEVAVIATEIRDGAITHDISQMKCPKCMYRVLCSAVLMGGDVEFTITREFVAKHRKTYGEEEDGRDTEESSPST